MVEKLGRQPAYSVSFRGLGRESLSDARFVEEGEPGAYRGRMVPLAKQRPRNLAALRRYLRGHQPQQHQAAANVAAAAAAGKAAAAAKAKVDAAPAPGADAGQ